MGSELDRVAETVRSALTEVGWGHLPVVTDPDDGDVHVVVPVDPDDEVLAAVWRAFYVSGARAGDLSCWPCWSRFARGNAEPVESDCDHDPRLEAKPPPVVRLPRRPG